MEKQYLLDLMRFWLFGTFVIVFAAVTAYLGIFSNRDWWLAVKAGFPVWGVAAVLAVVWYYVYKWYLYRK